jgi:hypothetical protein
MNANAKKLGILKLTEETEFFLCDPTVGDQYPESRFAIKLPCGNYEIYADDYMFTVVKAGTLKYAHTNFGEPYDEEAATFGTIVVDTATVALVPTDFFTTGAGAIFQTWTGSDGKFSIFGVYGRKNAWCGYTILF